MTHSNGPQVKHLNLSQIEPLLLLLYSPRLPSCSACSKFLSLVSAKLCVQDKGRFAIPNHECNSLRYSNS